MGHTLIVISITNCTFKLVLTDRCNDHLDNLFAKLLSCSVFITNYQTLGSSLGPQTLHINQLLHCVQFFLFPKLLYSSKFSTSMHLHGITCELVWQPLFSLWRIKLWQLIHIFARSLCSTLDSKVGPIQRRKMYKLNVQM